MRADERRLRELADGEILEHTYRMRHADGRYRWLHSRDVVFRRDEAGRVVQVLGLAQDVTEQKQAEQAVRDSEELFRTLGEAVPDFLRVADAQGRPLYQNPAWTQYTGLSCDDFERVGWEALYHPDDRPRLAALWDDAIESHMPFEVEMRLRRRDGTYRWFLGRTVPVTDASKCVVKWVGTLTDIDARKQIEEALIASERREKERAAELETVLQATPVPIWIAHDPQCRRITGNPASYRLVDLPPGTNLSSTPGEIGGPIQRGFREYRGHSPLPPHELPLHVAAVRGTEVHGAEISLVFDDGRARHLLGNAVPLRDLNGDVRGSIGAFMDITDLKRTQERLRLLWESAALLMSADHPAARLPELLAKIGPHLGLDACCCFLADAPGRPFQLAHCTGMSPEIAHAIGIDPDGSGSAMPPAEPIVATHIARSTDPGRALARSFGIRAFIRDPLLGSDGALGTLCFASRSRDWFDTPDEEFLRTIAQHVAVSYERHLLIHRLREADRRKDEFLATLAHELRNPLAPIRNAVHLLECRGPSDPGSREARQIIARQARHMTRLLEDLLDVARITRGQIHLRPERVDIAAAVRSAVETAAPLIEEACHELKVELPAEPITLLADPTRLSQAVLNLLTNAAKYTEPGGHIRLSVERRGDEVSISVTDDGIGIPAESLPGLFRMFARVAPTTNDGHSGGLGIGLALVRSLVELHGGRVTVQSEGPGRGSTFTIHLPLTAPDGRVSAPEADIPPDRARPAAPAAGCRVLVVDDNHDSARSLAALLRLGGYEAHTAYDGIEAVEAADRLRPDVILLDIGMPRLDGYGACRRIRSEPWGKSMTIIALTGWGQPEDRRRTEEAGFDSHLVKPVDPEEIERLLADLIPGPA